MWDRGGRVAGRVAWGRLRKGVFEELETRSIQHNDTIESLLDRDALEDVRNMQLQTCIMQLPLADRLEEVHTLVAGMRFARVSADDALADGSERKQGNAVSLAASKAHQLEIEAEASPSGSLLIPFHEISLGRTSQYVGRERASWRAQDIWMEWRQTAGEVMRDPQHVEQLERRVHKLAAVLSAPENQAHSTLQVVWGTRGPRAKENRCSR